ncbi:MAG: carboxylate/amino acid/amine transporter [Pelosinus sp.]|nr:carboxylate/amino acid/amine transporter [Pelosinus sp.]
MVDMCYICCITSSGGFGMGSRSLLFIEGILLLVAFIWGINPTIMKVGLFYLPPMPYNAVRMLIALLFAWLMLGLSKTYKPFDRQDVKLILLIGSAGFFIFQLAFTFGVQNTTAGNSSLILALVPASVAIINKLFGIEEIKGSMVIGIGMSLVGVIFIVMGSGKEISMGNDHLFGAFMMLIAQFAYGYYSVFSRPLLNKYSTYQVTAYMVTVATSLFIVVALPSLMPVKWVEVPLIAWFSVLYSGVFAICVGNFLWMWAIGKIGSTRTALYNNLSPIFAVASGYAFLDEGFGWLQFFGAVVIFLGMYLTRKDKGTASAT